MPPPRCAYNVPPDLDASSPPRRYTCSATPALHPLLRQRLQRVSRAPYLHCRYAYSAPLKLYTSVLRRLQTCRSLPKLWSFMPPSSSSARLQRDSRAQSSMPPMNTRLHVATPTSRLRSSRAPYLQYINRCVHVDTATARLQHYIPLLRQRLHRASNTPDLHVCTPASRFQTSMSTRLQCTCSTPHLHACTPAARLQSSRALEANTYTI